MTLMPLIPQPLDPELKDDPIPEVMSLVDFTARVVNAITTGNEGLYQKLTDGFKVTDSTAIRIKLKGAATSPCWDDGKH